MDMMHFSRQVLVHPANVHLNNDLNLQPGPPRTTEETTAGISDQLFLACRGQPDPVEDLQRNTGIKDKTAQFWIDMVTPKANEEIKLRTTNRETKDLRLKKKGTFERGTQGDQERNQGWSAEGDVFLANSAASGSL